METQKKILTKCRNGHWFSGSACPIDGYYDDFVDAVIEAEKTLRSEGRAITFTSIVTEGNLSEAAADARLLLAEFGGSFSKESQALCLVERFE